MRRLDANSGSPGISLRVVAAAVAAVAALRGSDAIASTASV